MSSSAAWAGAALVILAVGVGVATVLDRDSSSLIVFAGMIAGGFGLAARRRASSRNGKQQ